VVATQELLRETLFGVRRVAEVVLAYIADQPVGFALYFHNFSTFVGRAGIYLEDLFVEPAHRGEGVGKALLAYVAKLAVERGCGRFEWAVLDWNTPAIDFYRSLGAVPLDDWTIFRLTGDALHRVAAL
jgi:GNAT superfamily N-acetyltransferase